MSLPPNNPLYLEACRARTEEAKARLTLGDVWDLAPRADQSLFPVNGLDVVRSPLRDDRTPSFSIFANGKAFADKARAEVKGGVWEFVQFCRPELQPGEVARLLVERAGLLWPSWSDYSAEAAKGPKESDADKAKRMKEERLAKIKAEAARRDQAERERKADRDGKLRRAARLPEWPSCVEERWAEGVGHRDAHPKLVAALCEKRGWPVDWADMLCGFDLLAFPLESRWQPGQAGAKRMVAFRVQAPAVGGGPAALVDVGYHQKFFNVAELRSGWRFFPSAKIPKRAESAWSDYERELVEVAKRRGVGEGDSMVPPLPFVAGCVERPRLVVIMEGQWDALTFMGALGGLHVDCGGPADIAYFGIRGVSGTRAFLDYWGGWLRVAKPLVWLLPDNDAAKTGGDWYPPGRVAERRPGVLYFSERLAWLGAARVVVTPLRGGSGGKDFNDYYRAARPDPAAMWRWMAKLGLA